MSESVVMVNPTLTIASLEHLEPKCLVNFIYVYAEGQIPPGTDLSEAPNDFDSTTAHFEDHEWEWANMPQVGDSCEWRSLQWNVVAVYPYLSDDDSQVYIAICAQDTSIPQREDWSGEPSLLYVPVLLGGDIARNEDGSTHFGLCDRHEDIPSRSVFSGWEFSDWQQFRPVGQRAPQEYREIIICWCVEQPEAAELNPQQI